MIEVKTFGNDGTPYYECDPNKNISCIHHKDKNCFPCHLTAKKEFAKNYGEDFDLEQEIAVLKSQVAAMMEELNSIRRILEKEE